jgi:hypothetical protein
MHDQIVALARAAIVGGALRSAKSGSGLVRPSWFPTVILPAPRRRSARLHAQGTLSIPPKAQEPRVQLLVLLEDVGAHWKWRGMSPAYTMSPAGLAALFDPMERLDTAQRRRISLRLSVTRTSVAPPNRLWGIPSWQRCRIRARLLCRFTGSTRSTDRTRIEGTSTNDCGIVRLSTRAGELQFGTMGVDDAKRLKSLEQENVKLKKLLVDRMLDIEVLKDINANNGERARSSAAGGPRASAGSCRSDERVRSSRLRDPARATPRSARSPTRRS